MIYNFNGRNLNIPDNEIANSMKALEISKEEAIELWLEDNDFEENAEQKALDEKAKQIKIDHGASATGKKKVNKPKTVKISDEKAQIFSDIVALLSEKYEISVEILNKKVGIALNGKNFSLDLVEHRPKK